MSESANRSRTNRAQANSVSSERFVYEDDRKMEKPFDWQQFLRLLKYLAPYKSKMWIVAVTMLIVTASKLAVPYLISVAIDDAIVGAGGNVRLLLTIVGVILALYLAGWVANSLRIKWTNWIGQKVIYDLRMALFKNIQRLSFRFFDQRPAGSILVRITNDINSLQDLFTNGIINLLTDLLLLIGITGVLLSLNVKLALALLVTVPMMFFLSTKLRLKIRRGWQQVRVQQSRINSHLNESIQGMRVTQAFTQEGHNTNFFAGMNEENSRVWRNAVRRNDKFGPLVDLTSAIGTCILFWYGAYLLQTEPESMSIGILLAFSFYLGNFWEPISRLGQIYSQLLVTMASSERIFEFLDEQPLVAEREQARALPPIKGDVEFKSVEFAYEEGRPALNGIGLSAAAGETIALVGHTGSGKSTIINLLCRFYDPNKGSITIDGIDLRDVTLDSLRSQIGIVLQDTFIFSGTIRENIRFGQLDATDEEVEAAAKAVQAHEFISRLPDGYETEVEERGSVLSVGERQLISFARAILADPRILILDEATASIDTETEVRIQEALQTLLQGRTSFIIAHRLSTIRHADKIIVLDHGNIVECGTHESLMERRGVYYGLMKAQFTFFEAS
ncbi:ABC transporter ATP-binding protein [Numidum massiliense]|uniref:ABC transporter ATP-binding protein n=1 Tax=Numidum massiliense TaxID=1522315 RepID=UPI0006D56826|nr:ABC transporter ATP-binding protein [Numidum massiliense]